ncbi:MAG TPA: hypothetical protein VG591_08265 [Burkholderiales bacterium]|jgi:hypothetical protein|nr:hypothetical protein [Burkholderiales bacterium]
MKPLVWMVALGLAAGLAYWLWSWQRRWTERKRASEERFASFMAQAISSASAQTKTAPPPPDLAALAKQKLLLEAATKAGEAGEAVLSIQLYARLLSRYPDSSYAAQARAAVEAQKKKLAKS